MHLTELKYVIEEAICRLPNGDSRFAITDFALGDICKNYFYEPDIVEQLASSYRVPTNNTVLEKQFFEEIKVLEDIMIEKHVPINTPDWCSTSSSDMMGTMNRRGYAFQLWDWYAIPWRIDGDELHTIIAPNDLMGTPIIKSRPVKYFLSSIAYTLDEQQKNLEKLELESSLIEKKLLNWKGIAITVMVIVGIILWQIATK